MIESILPAGVIAVDTFVDPPDATLFLEEELAISKAVQKRRLEYTTARWCARQAMSRLGRPAAPVLRGPRGEPQWPAGLVGSITHCVGYRSAVLAEAIRFTTIGIDAEPHEALSDDVLETVSLPEERGRIDELRWHHPRVHWDRLLFSAKESVYKAWFPLTLSWLGFEDANVVVNPLAGTFAAHLKVAGPLVNGRPLTGFTGRWLVGHGLIVTAIAMPAPVSPPVGPPAGSRPAAFRRPS